MLTHTPLGRAKFKAVADADRVREYCILFKMVVMQCSGFPIDHKPVYDRGGAIYSTTSRAEVETLVREMRQPRR